MKYRREVSTIASSFHYILCIRVCRTGGTRRPCGDQCAYPDAHVRVIIFHFVVPRAGKLSRGFPQTISIYVREHMIYSRYFSRYVHAAARGGSLYLTGETKGAQWEKQTSSARTGRRNLLRFLRSPFTPGLPSSLRPSAEGFNVSINTDETLVKRIIIVIPSAASLASAMRSHERACYVNYFRDPPLLEGGAINLRRVCVCASR